MAEQADNKIEVNENEKQIIEEIKNELEFCKKDAEDRLNQLKYLQADFDNYRKHFEKEKRDIIKLANENLIKELISILDDFESSVRIIENDQNREGLQNLQKKFFQILEMHGLEEIESLGNKFDPNFHEVLCKELSEHDDDLILEEIQKGYVLNNKVIRPSKVKVAKNDEKNLKTNENKKSKIGELNYNGFNTKFYMTQKVENYIKDKNVKSEELLKNNHQFYEVELFEIIDEDDDGIPDKEFGKEFEVIYYGIVEKWINNSHEGFEDNINIKNNDILSDSSITIYANDNHKSFGVKYKILKINN